MEVKVEVGDIRKEVVVDGSDGATNNYYPWIVAMNHVHVESIIITSKLKIL